MDVQISIRLTPALAVALILISAGIAHGSDEAKLILTSKIGNNELSFAQYVGQKLCKYSHSCTKIKLNGKEVAWGYGDTYEINGLFPDKQRSELAVITLPTGGNATVSFTTLVDIQPSTPYAGEVAFKSSAKTS